MFFSFKKERKIGVNWVFGIIAGGIIVFCSILIIILCNKAWSVRGLVDTAQFEAEKARLQEKVVSVYAESLSKLKQDVQGIWNWNEIYKLTEEKFFSLHVPQKCLDQHLQTWILVTQLNGSDKAVADKKTELLKILDKLIAAVKG
jgi:hypothetical protein